MEDMASSMEKFVTTKLPGMRGVVFYIYEGPEPHQWPDLAKVRDHWGSFCTKETDVGARLVWHSMVFGENVPEDLQDLVCQVTGLKQALGIMAVHGAQPVPQEAVDGKAALGPWAAAKETSEESPISDWHKAYCRAVQEATQAVVDNSVVAKAAATKPSILQRAHDVIYGDRARSYGRASENHRHTAAFMSAWLAARGPGTLDAYDTVAFNIGQKLARLAFNLRTHGKLHEDSVLDGAGYFGNFEKIQDEIEEDLRGQG